MQNINKLIVWAKDQSSKFESAAEKANNLSMSNIYFARKEWIDFELLPKLEEILHTSSKKRVSKNGNCTALSVR